MFNWAEESCIHTKLFSKIASMDRGVQRRKNIETWEISAHWMQTLQNSKQANETQIQIQMQILNWNYHYLLAHEYTGLPAGLKPDGERYIVVMNNCCTESWRIRQPRLYTNFLCFAFLQAPYQRPLSVIPIYIIAQ